MKQFNRNPYGPPVLDPNIDFSSVFSMLGMDPSAMGGGGLGGALGGQAPTRQGTLSNAANGP
jgi:hypothetical protein